jgi:predicted DCC family thiol-disulfide oxidoreductase YuxK
MNTFAAQSSTSTASPPGGVSSASLSASVSADAATSATASGRLPLRFGAEQVREQGQEGDYAVVLFDGVCNLCNAFVNFVIEHDPNVYFRLGALQDEAAQPYLQAAGLEDEALDSVVLIENGRVYRRSTAALRVLRWLDGAWPLLYSFIVVPRPIRDTVYDWIAERRYDWFGRRDTCRVPTPDEQRHFI